VAAGELEKVRGHLLGYDRRLFQELLMLLAKKLRPVHLTY
jgi:hypothetical protein